MKSVIITETAQILAFFSGITAAITMTFVALSQGVPADSLLF